jgi:hypothetical protein
MKKATLVLLALGLLSMISFAAEVLIIKGDIIDNKCAEANKADLANFVKSHRPAKRPSSSSWTRRTASFKSWSRQKWSVRS